MKNAELKGDITSQNSDMLAKEEWAVVPVDKCKHLV